MTQKTFHVSPFPTNEQILEFIKDSPGRVGKREIARAFQLDADQKLQLKKVLKKLKDDGLLSSTRKRLADPAALPPVTVVEVNATDIDGELLGRPVVWESELAPPVIYMAPVRRGQGALGVGDRVLARMVRIDDTEDGHPAYEASCIRRLEHAPSDVLGVYKLDNAGHGRLRSTDRRHRDEYVVLDTGGLTVEEGDLVRAEILPGKKLGLRQVKLREKIKRTGAQAITQIAIYDRSIPVEFTDEAVAQARAAGPAVLGKREDLRDTALITIDGEDARDFDDAVFAEPDDDPNNPGGWHLIVAIADVSWYVRPNDALDQCAYQRGNSVYFPDRVVPMLPEELSNGWCSLRPDEERPCIAAHMWIDAHGVLRRHKFVRGLMKSVARTTYTQIQQARDGQPDDLTRPLVDTIITPLYGAFKSLLKAREQRGVLELDLAERQIVLAEDGTVEKVIERARFDSHKLIEEFMVLANVAAAEALESKSQPCMYRVHDEPSQEKLASLREFLETVDIPFAKGQVVRASHFNQILAKVKDTANSHMVSEVVLRSQAQAVYSPNNLGHFGLALRRYCHFTSPIRRYSDLLVHRALVKGFKLGDGGLEDGHRDFVDMGEHLSTAERNAAAAERDAVDRFTALYLADKVGTLFKGRINGVTRFGVFVTLDDTGADGLVPIRSLGEDFFVHDEHSHTLWGRETGYEYRLGDKVEVMIMESDPISGSTLFKITQGGSQGKIRPDGRGKGRFAKGGPNAGRPSGAPSGRPTGRPAKPKKPKGKSRASRRKAKQP
ncbi:ribonuclease R [Magnetovibrio blakemorei]|uniref:Ribonuclease R n=1 Tax=Magnetovibrio blakemorei TaxID=28181 RepID=A0A1E5Q765_9PROT|nr:ribonuclease R [Magnetovibrio blakemorei]OEJ66792.1 ribonuclease R [Magnetovibrio blakemorei]